MRVAILSQNSKLYSTARLVEALEIRKHKARVINPLRCYMDVTSTKPEIHYRGEEVLRNFDAVIPRIGASITFYGLAVLRQLELMGLHSLNSSDGFARARDKLHSLQLLSKSNIGLPTTAFARAADDIDDIIKIVGGPPLIVKLIEGTQGKGVVLAETTKAAASVIQAFQELDANILVQEFIKEAAGADLRCFVVGNQVVAAMQRKAREGEFRANLHRGATASIAELTEEEQNTAVQAAKIMGLGVAGVDILRSSRGPLVLEINASPGLEGIEKTTGVDVAGKIVEYLEKKVIRREHKGQKNQKASA
ncbi:MAG: 30S ribosomal protein S6--L-glutamate ligase [Alphaproteobacteria bacterium]|nr:MAG: 30S ribosomal protein S6--L-glutamate ligase [Alphaproteobacteria bacterium]